MKTFSKKRHTRKITNKNLINKIVKHKKTKVNNEKLKNKTVLRGSGLKSGLKSVFNRFLKKPKGENFEEFKFNNPLSASSSTNSNALVGNTLTNKLSLTKEEQSKIANDQAILTKIAIEITKMGISLMLFDFDKTASKEHIYNKIIKDGIQLNDIVKTIEEEKNEKYNNVPGTYFSKCFEQKHGDKIQYLHSNSYFFSELVKVLHKYGILVGIVSRGDCNVIQKVLNAVFKNEEERKIYIPDLRIEGGNHIENPQCPDGIGRSSGKKDNKYKNEAIQNIIDNLNKEIAESQTKKTIKKKTIKETINNTQLKKPFLLKETILIDDEKINIDNLTYDVQGLHITGKDGIHIEDFYKNNINLNLKNGSSFVMPYIK